jgi:hypothetical protein
MSTGSRHPTEDASPKTDFLLNTQCCLGFAPDRPGSIQLHPFRNEEPKKRPTPLLTRALLVLRFRRSHIKSQPCFPCASTFPHWSARGPLWSCQKSLPCSFSVPASVHPNKNPSAEGTLHLTAGLDSPVFGDRPFFALRNASAQLRGFPVRTILSNRPRPRSHFFLELAG